MPTATSVTSNTVRYRVSPHAPIFKISLLSIALMLSDVGAVSPVLPDLAAHYPDQDQASIQGFISFPAIAALAATITAGALATRVGKRRLVLTGISLIVVGGLAPIFLIPITSYPVVLGGSPPGRLRHGPPPTVGLLPRRRLLRRPGAPHPAGVAVLHGRRRRHYVVAGRLRTHDLRVDAGLPGLPPGTDHAGPGVALHPRTAPSRRAEECRAPGRGAGGGPRPPARVCPAAPLGPSPSCSS